MNRFLERRIVKDKRNPYGSRGGYVMPNRRDRMMKEPYYDDMEDTYPSRPTRDYRGYDYNYDMNYRDYSSVDKEYKQDLKMWIDKLKRKDKYGMTYEQVIQQAENMGVKFRDYTELEFYATFLMMVSDFGDMISDPNILLKMAKQFLEDDDIEVSPSEKLCIYLYQIVLGEE